jgi:TonB-dependent receptor
MEWYNDRVGLLQVAVYRKQIDNFIFLNNAITASELNPDGINISQPQNGTEATVTGVEFGVQQQLRSLPSPFDGLGFIANVTLQETEASTGDPTRIPLGRDKIPLINAPDAQGNLSLFYEKYGIEARVSYNYSAAYIEDTRDNGVDKWIQAWDRVDLSARYTIPKTRFNIGLEVQNLLDTHAYWATKGRSSGYQKDYVESGRNFFLTLSFQH